MKNPTLVHGIWALGIVAALAVGWIQFGPDPSREAAGEGSPAHSRARGQAAGRDTRGSKSANADEMKSAVASHLLITDSTEARKSFAAILLALTPVNAEATVGAWMAGRGSPNVWNSAVKREYAKLLKEWGRIDGATAMAFADRLETGLSHKAWSRNSAISGWGSGEPEEALAWVKEHADGDGPLTQQLLWGIAEHDIALATDYVLAAPNDPNAGVYIDRLARQQWSVGGRDLANWWVRHLPDGPLKARALDTIAAFVAAEKLQESSQ